MRFKLVSALGIIAMAASTQATVLVGNDQTTNPAIWAIDETGMNPPTNLLTGTNATAWGMAYDQNSQTLYWNNAGTLMSAPYVSGQGSLTPSVIGSMSDASGSMNVTGMAFDTTSNTLYGYRSVSATGFYSISTANAFCTAANLFGNSDFGGFDYNPADGFFYGLNDNPSTTLIPGRGLYRISGVGATLSFAKLADYPGTDTDIDGLAAGPSTLYLVNDVPAQGLPTYSLTSSAYGATLTSPFTATNGIFSAGAYVPNIPEPTTLALVGGVALIALRRR